MNSMSLKNKLSLAAAAAIMLVGVIITVEVFISAKSRMETGLAEQVGDMGNVTVHREDVDNNSSGSG